MPIYEYQCNACQHQIEILQKPTDAPLTQCPECKQNKLRKLISATTFQLKGTGWYETDFKNAKEHKKTADKTDPDKQSKTDKTDKKDPDKPSKTDKKKTSETETAKPSTPNHAKNKTTD